MMSGVQDEKQAYPRHDDVPQLLRSVVAFIDLLGTSEHATRANAQATLERLDASLRRARNQSGIDEALSWFHASWFSDSLSICAPLVKKPQQSTDRAFEESALGFVLDTITWLQFILAIHGFALRGGLTVGPQFADDRVNFGPALVEAVALEHCAEFPRVVVDDQTLQVVDDHIGDHFTLSDSPFHHELMTAPDGKVFVSYLGAATGSQIEARQMLDHHQSAIAKSLVAHVGSSEGIVQKYEWLARYHNTFCNTFFPDWTDVRLPGVETDDGFIPYVPAGWRPSSSSEGPAQ